MGRLFIVYEFGTWGNMVFECLIAAFLGRLAVALYKAQGVFLIRCNSNADLIA